MNSISELSGLEDSDIFISEAKIEGIKTRTIIHPVLQDGYKLTLLLKQRRWHCTNNDCRYENNESFKFVNRSWRSTNATDMMIVTTFRNLSVSATAIAKRFNVSDTHVLDVFDRYVHLDRFIMVERIGNGKIYDSRLSNGPIESINRKVSMTNLLTNPSLMKMVKKSQGKNF